MKLFKLFALSLVALPSVALGMSNFQPIPKDLEKKFYSPRTGEPNIYFLLYQFFAPDSKAATTSEAKSNVQPVSSHMRWFPNLYMIGGGLLAAVLGASYVYRDTLAELIRNPAPAIEKAQSFWAQTAAPRAMSLWTGIKSVFSR